MKLTDLAVKNLAAESGQRTFFDDTLKGFGVRVTPKSKTFVLVIHRRNRNKWEVLGKYPVVSLSRAREEARNRLSAIQLGQRSTAPIMTFEEAYALFLASYKAKNRPKTIYEMGRLVNRHLMPKLKRNTLDEITTQDLTTIIDKLLPTPGECAATFTAARTLFRWIARRRLIERSPLEAVPVPASATSRDRIFSDDELRSVWGACCPPTTFTHIVKLLILTGQRKTQIAHLRAEWIDKEAQTITWPASMMKGGRAHTIPYGGLTAAILAALPKKGLLFPARGRETPFNGFSKSTAAFNSKLGGVAPWTLHDLRRTFSTNLARLRVMPHIKEMLLAHATAKSDVERIYDLHSYLDEMREAMHRYEGWLHSLLSSELATGSRA